MRRVGKDCANPTRARPVVFKYSCSLNQLAGGITVVHCPVKTNGVGSIPTLRAMDPLHNGSVSGFDPEGAGSIPAGSTMLYRIMIRTPVSETG